MLAVVSARSFSNSGAQDLKEIIKLSSQYGAITKISSIYKMKPTYEFRMRFGKSLQPLAVEGLVLVFAIETEASAAELLQHLVEIENKYQQGKQYQAAGIHLLMYGDVITALPQITLPHPELHLHPEELVPAAEILPEHKHPVLNMTLKELARHSQQGEWGEFYSQGPSLVDFSKTNE